LPPISWYEPSRGAPGAAVGLPVGLALPEPVGGRDDPVFAGGLGRPSVGIAVRSGPVPDRRGAVGPALPDGLAVVVRAASASFTARSDSGAVACSVTSSPTSSTAPNPTDIATAPPDSQMATSSTRRRPAGTGARLVRTMPTAFRVAAQAEVKPSTSVGPPATRGTPEQAARRYRRVVPQLLLIEDDADIRVALSRALAERGHGVQSEPTALAGLRAAVDGQPDLVVLDLGLPDLDGCTLLRMIRAVSQVPVVVVTARDDESEIIRALDAGADDYVVKPFAPDHLNARIRAVLRRAGGTDQAERIVVGELRIDPRSRDAVFAGQPLELSRKEFDMLLFLARRPGEVVSKPTLLAEVWHQPYGRADKTVDVHLSWLRRKLGESAAEPRYLQSVRGVGVKLVDPGA
jgi:DNA-binding response OmpR family regulator